MGARGKAEILEFYNGRKRGLEAQRNIDRKAAESWGFNFYGEPITAINLSGMYQTEKPKKIDGGQNKKSKEFLDENNDGIPDMVERPELSDEEKARAVVDNKEVKETTAVLNQKQLKKAETEFNKFQKKTNNQIAMLKKNISDKKKQMNRLTSFSKESLVNRKNIMKEEIKSLEAQLKEKEDLLQNTDINAWLDTMASKKLKKEIEVGKSSAELAKEYLQSRNL
jgi:transcriptional regulator NrdR family protein